MATRQFNIAMGPSREELFDALRLRHENRPVYFDLPYLGGRFKVEVDEIGIEDGSGNSWLLKLHDPKGLLGANRLEAYFNTNSRSGWIRPLS